jgi:tetratricopeptide (TPR) repeat protein
LTQLLEIDKDRSTQHHRLRGLAYFQLHEWPRIIADLTEAVKGGVSDPKLYFERGLAHYFQEEWDEAIDDLSAYVRLAPTEPDGFLWRGQSRAHCRKWQEAIDDYSGAIKLNAGGERIWVLRGTAHAELQHWDQTVRDFSEAIERSANRADALTGLARAALARQDRAAYRAACVSVYERLSGSTDPQDWNNGAWICSLAANEGPDPSRLVDLAKKAVSKAPKSYIYISTLGTTLYRAQKYVEAISKINEAIKAHGKGGGFEDWVFLAMTRFKQGDAAQAKQDLAHAVRLYDEGIKAVEADWIRRFEWPLLRKEAEALIQPTPKSPPTGSS